MKKLVFYSILLILCISCENDDYSKSPPSAQDFIKEFKSRFKLDLKNAPVYYNEFEATYVSTIYKEDYLYRIYIDNTGEVSSKLTQPIFPIGNQKVLCIVRLDAKIDFTYFIEEWEKAQDGINQQYIYLSDSLGYSSPLVQFENTNIYLGEEEFPEYSGNTILSNDFKSFANQNDINLLAYDLYLFLDMNLDNPDGGWGDWKSRYAKIGWFYEDPELDTEKLEGIAYAAYHHEIGHVWGWEHEWTDPYDDNGFITDLSLFGWTDLDGDGVAEIIDDDSY